MRRVLVTGGSGFIGTHLVERLLRDGNAVVNLDLRPPQVGEHERSWLKGDLLDRVTVDRLVDEFEPDVLVNLAANAELGASGAALSVNTQGLRNLLDANHASRNPGRIVHASTQYVVRPGYQPRGPRDYAPYTEYGKSKADSEEVLWQHGGEDWVIIRPTVVWGPYHRVMATSTMRYLRRRWYAIPNGRSPVRSYGYVGNVVAQIVASLTSNRDAVHRQVFYVGDDPMPSGSWLDAMSRELSGKPVRRVPMFLFRGVAEGGELLSRVGGPSPLNRGRLFRMTTDAPVPMAATFNVLGHGPFDMTRGVRETAAWLRHEYPGIFA